MPKPPVRRSASGKPFGTVIVDPPWPYEEVSSKNSSGYSVEKYRHLSIADIEQLPISNLADYCFLWTTSPFSACGDATKVARAWGFIPITQIYWVKATKTSEGIVRPDYGVGYWFRGCVEPILVCKQPGVKSIRTPWLGVISPTMEHSRKPDSIHEIVESYFPPPYGELFARRERTGWTTLGNECPNDGRDIRESLRRYL
jgi:N6-adenosine-specific RNA methylase IME4